MIIDLTRLDEAGIPYEVDGNSLNVTCTSREQLQKAKRILKFIDYISINGMYLDEETDSDYSDDNDEEDYD